MHVSSLKPPVATQKFKLTSRFSLHQSDGNPLRYYSDHGRNFNTFNRHRPQDARPQLEIQILPHCCSRDGGFAAIASRRVDPLPRSLRIGVVAGQSSCVGVWMGLWRR